MSHLSLTGAGAPSSSALAPGDYFIRDQYEYTLATGLTTTTQQDDGSSGDVTTHDDNPTGAASGATKEMTFFKAYASAVSFDSAKFNPWNTDQLDISLSYSNDFVTWNPFDGAGPLIVPGLGTYDNWSGQLTQANTQTTAKYFRLSVRDTAASSKVGSSDFRIFDGVTERTN